MTVLVVQEGFFKIFSCVGNLPPRDVLHKLYKLDIYLSQDLPP